MDEEMKSNRIYVGGVTNNVVKEAAEQEFGKFGKVTDVWFTYNLPGFGFVEFESEKAAKSAVDNMNAVKFKGHVLRVELSKAKGTGPIRPNRGRGRKGRPDGRPYYNNRYGNGLMPHPSPYADYYQSMERYSYAYEDRHAYAPSHYEDRHTYAPSHYEDRYTYAPSHYEDSYPARFQYSYYERESPYPPPPPPRRPYCGPSMHPELPYERRSALSPPRGPPSSPFYSRRSPPKW